MARQREQTGIEASMRPILTGVITGILATSLMLLLFSLWITMQDTPHGMVNPLAILSLCVGAFLAGLICTKATRTGGLVYGAVCGLVLSFLVIAAALIAGAGGIGAPGIFRVVFIMLSAMIGGVLGVNMRRKPGRR